MNAPSILIAEDSDEDFFTLNRIFKKLAVSYPIVRCTGGEETLDFLYRRGKYTHLADTSLPALVLLDLNLIGLDGRVVLERIKQDPALKRLPVVILTTSSNPRDVAFCYECGANSYVLKPVHFDHFTRTMELLVGY
ncbi:response regulator [Dictyobacter aurantiacus]|uniref:Response regulator n=1 Tax=Dictyobacter aurantiacus TaxID=1936993 RepID=A0A401ZPF5_9CHLR|nr:response regulator [Dictyobacter aurantiacus]GCE08788.1 response regulator [Dictyobacter aurantiacus]